MGVLLDTMVREGLSKEFILEENEVRKQILLLSEGRAFLAVGRKRIKTPRQEYAVHV